MKAIKQLRRTSSRNDKIQIINENKDNQPFLAVLQFAYEPLWHYGIRQVPKPTETGDRTFEDRINPIVLLLESLRDGILSGNQAKIEVMRILNRLDKDGQDLLKCVIKKDLRAGISVATINQAIFGFITPFEVMRAKTFDGCLTSPMYMSLKLEGLRSYRLKNSLYTRNGIVIQGVDHIIEQIDKLGTYDFDGELLIPGEHFQVSSGKIRSFTMTPRAVLNVFDIPSIKAPFKERYEALTELFGPNDLSHVKLVKHILTKDIKKVHATFEKALAAGFEGLVLKTPNHFYQQKRSKDWLKLKNNQSEDLPICGYAEGTGKYEGSLGALHVQRPNGVVVRVGSGLSDAERDEIWKYRDLFKGRIVEVMYHEETPDGSLRHPRFKGFRPDKYGN